MASALLQFCLSAGVVIVAGSFLVRFSDQIAESTKLGRLFVGSLFLAAATSLPELFVDLSAIQKNMPDMAVGDLMGSSLLNLFILAIADLLHKGSSTMFSPAAANHALGASLSICMTSLAGVGLFVEPQFPNFVFLGLGVGSWALIFGYAFGLRIIYFEQSKVQRDNKEEKNEKKSEKKMTLKKAVLGYLASAVTLLVAAPFLSESAGEIADQSGLGKTFIGTTLVALSTSLPELVSTITSVRMGAYDLALGNIFGSNTFNMLLFIPLDIAQKGPLFAAVSQVHLFSCFAIIFITTVAIIGQLYHVEKRRAFIEPDAFAVMSLVIGALAGLYFMR